MRPQLPASDAPDDNATSFETDAGFVPFDRSPASAAVCDAPFGQSAEDLQRCGDPVAVADHFSPTDDLDEAPLPLTSTTRRWLTGTAGVICSGLVHAWLFLSLAGMFYELDRDLTPIPIETRFLSDAEITEPIEIVTYELANPDDRELEQRVAVNAMSLGQVKSETAKQEIAPVSLLTLDPNLRQQPMFDIPEGLSVSETLVVQGTTGEALIQMDAALDRVTWEVARHLQERRVLVVWLLDASGSLDQQRIAIGKRLKRIYGELDALEKAEQFPKQDRPLLSGVVAFGQQTTYLTKEPTDDFATIEDAFSKVQNDPSGTENVFTAVNSVMDRWHKFRIDQGRRILLIVVTDEAGDDHGVPLDFAINKCRRYGAVANVIGPASPFGKRRGYVPYRAPEDGQTYQIPVDLGPESVVVENVDVPYWYAGPQYENLSSGFGPYALSRLVRETGGVYFMTNMTTMAGLATVGSYDSQRMKAFEPDYRFGSAPEFLKDIAKHPIRAAVFAMAQHSQTTNLKSEGTPVLEFRLQPNNFRQTLTNAQRSAAVTQFAIDAILNAAPPNAEKAYAAEPSLRWRLAFNLNYGRILAQKVRALEYNSALAQLKTSYTDSDIANRVNHLILRPDKEVQYAPALRKAARLAQDHLERVIAEAPGTPWAIMAARELRDGFGIRVVERYIAPPPPQPKNQNKNDPSPTKKPRFIPDPKANVPGPTGPPAPKPRPPLPKL